MNNEQINQKDCEYFGILIDDYLEGTILPGGKQELEEHLKECAYCRDYMNGMTELMEKTQFLPKEALLSDTKKDELWRKIEQEISSGVHAANIIAKNASAENGRAKAGIFYRYRNAISAIAAVFLLASIIFLVARYTGEKDIAVNDNKITTNVQLVSYWKVSSVKGNPASENTTLKQFDSVAIGEWITTNDTSSAELLVSNIGKVTIEPKSRVRLVKSEGGEKRMQVEYGTIDADINANPRTFFVEVPSVTAVDLGCSYKLNVDSAGNGLLYVKNGSVSLESAGRESLVPAGKFCVTKKDLGPGTPFRGNASPELKKALMDFDFGNCAGACVNTILRNSKKADAVTLVSILPRVEKEYKDEVYNKVWQYVPPPRAIPHDSIPYINPDCINQWIEKIQEEVQEKIEKNMEKMQEQLEKMNEEMDTNTFDWQEWGKHFGEEFGKEFQKNWRWNRTPKAQDEDEDNEDHDTAVYYDKEQLKQQMEQMKNQFDNEQFKEEMQKAKEEMKEANKELKEQMKEMKKELKEQLKEQFDSTGHKHHVHINMKDGDNNDEVEPTQPNEPEVPEQKDQHDDDN